uniref:Uncharacterized protein n=1 Tax=Anguilla anguilla TaxID=7936 RepID=A0A0E9Q7K3_ANGAN
MTSSHDWREDQSITATMKQLEQSDKDLLSQTRTLAMSFVKCASTDTEHQYKLVKDISF